MSIKHRVKSKDINGGTEVVTLTRGSAIKRFCLECMGFNANEIRRCTAPLCPLFAYRLGTESPIITAEE